jgi:hypothetical protein
MTRTGFFLVLSLAMAACTKSAKQEEAPAPPDFSDAGAGAATRIGRSLQDSVVGPELRTCWAQLKGEGALAMDMTYRKSGNSWVFDSVKVKKSSLPEDQSAAAQRCMEAAARGTTFPVDSKEALETAAPTFIVRLGWPVPLPAEGTEMTTDQMARMIGTGGSGGLITVPGCSACVRRTEAPYGNKCVAKSTGSNVDCEEINSNTCAVTPQACLRAGFGGGARGIFMW